MLLAGIAGTTDVGELQQFHHHVADAVRLVNVFHSLL